ncbi:MAG: neuraminidase-like domain-containing protein [Nitrospira sp.]
MINAKETPELQPHRAFGQMRELQGSPLSVLLKRRPDLAEIELSCENSNTPLPYVDLVMEILENAAGRPFPHPIDVPNGADVIADLDRKIINRSLRAGLTTISPPLSDKASVEVTSNGSSWTIKDGARRLGVAKDALTFKRSGDVPARIVTGDATADVAQLTQNQPPTSVRNSIGTIFVSFPWIPPDGSRTFKPTQITVTSRQPGKQWTIAYRFELTIVHEFRQGSVTFSAEGVASDITPWDLTQAILGSLLNNRIPPEIQQGYFGGASNVRLLETRSDEELELWKIGIERSAEVEYFPLALTWYAPQTSGSPEELKSQPEHLNRTAYDALRSAVYPWNLPFDLWIEEARTYLTHLGVPRSQLMETFYRERGFGKPRLPGDGMTTGNFWAAPERLGLTKADLDIISGRKKGTGTDNDADSGPWNFWGFRQNTLSSTYSIPDPADSTARITSGDWVTVLMGRVDVFLQQSGLSYDELRELLDMRYVNTTDTGDPVLQILLGTLPLPSTDGGSRQGLTCDLSKARLVKVSDTIRDEEVAQLLERLHRFVRLWRRIGWPMRDIDQALVPSGIRWPGLLLDEGLVGTLDRERQSIQSYLHRKEYVYRLHANNLYRDYSVEGEPVLESLYERLFLNKSLIGPTDPAFKVFQLNAARTDLEPQNPPALVKDHLQHIAAVCGLSIQDATLLLDRFDDDQLPLTLPNLSRLYFAALTARTARISVPELLALRRLRESNTLFYDTPVVPQAVVGPLAAPLELGLKFRSTISGEITVVRYWKPAGEVGSHIGRIWDASGTLLASVSFRHETDSGWQEQRLVEPLRIKANTTYVVSVNANTLHALTDQGMTTTQQGYLAPVGDGLNGVQGPGGTFPTTSSNSPNYFRDIGFMPFNFGLPTIRRVESVTAAGFSYSEALSLLTHKPSPGLAAAEHTEAAAALLDIRNRLSRMAAETTDTPAVLDEPREAVRRELTQLGWHPQVISELFEVLGELRSYKVNLAVLPDGVDLPITDVPYVRFENDGFERGHLIADKMITRTDWEKLSRLSRDKAYSTALKALFQAPGPYINRDLCSYESRDVSITSLKWPAGLVFPPDLEARAYYDVEHKRLHFIGPIDDVAAAQLQGLVTNLPDANELRNDLARLRSSYETVPSSVERLLNEAEKVALRDELREPSRRFTFLLAKLVPYRRQLQTLTALRDQLATATGLKATTVGKLLQWVRSSREPVRALAKDDFLDPDFAESSLLLPVVPGRFPHQFKSYIRLRKVASLVSRFRLSDEALGWLFGPTAIPNGWLNPNRLPAGADESPAGLLSLLRTANLFRLRDRIPGGEATLSEIFAMAAEDISGTALLERLSVLTGWNLSDLKVLTGPNGFHYKTDVELKAAFKDEILMLLLIDCFAVIKRLGATAEQCLRWSQAEIVPQEAAEIKRLARSRHTDTSWQEVTKPLRDVLREKQRQALVAHLIVRQQLRDSNDLYNRYLIDVEMSPCTMTARIKQACASIQLFVQRCLLNLEPEVPPSAIDTQLWSWMKNYRVWEANRKVFLYPENWLEPGLRTDKTPFFKEMESSLLQDDVRAETVERAFQGYLHNLQEVAQLDVRALCEETPEVDIRIRYRLQFSYEPGTSMWVWFSVLVDNVLIDADYFTEQEKVLERELLVSVSASERTHLEVFAKYLIDLGDSPLRLKSGSSIIITAADTGKTLFNWHSATDQDIGNNGVLTQANLATADKEVTRLHVIARTQASPNRYFHQVRDNNTGSWSSWRSIGQNITSDYLCCIYMGGRLWLFWPVLVQVPSKSKPPDNTASQVWEIRLAWTCQVNGVWQTKKEWHVPLRLEHITSDKFSIDEFYFEVTRPLVGRLRIRCWANNRTGSWRIGDFQFSVGTMLVEVAPNTSIPTPDKPIDYSSLGVDFHLQRFEESPRPKPDPLLVPDNNVPLTILPTTPGRFVVVSTDTPLRFPSLDQKTAFVFQDDMAEASTFQSAVFFVTTSAVNSKGLKFEILSHPLANLFVQRHSREGVAGLLTLDNQQHGHWFPSQFVSRYQVTEKQLPLIDASHLGDLVDFSPRGNYSVHNWELFFHSVLLIADHLSRNQRFEEAHRWFHYIFDPTSDSEGSSPGRYWRFLPFHKAATPAPINELLALLQTNPKDPEGLRRRDELRASIADWKRNPFDPHRIARLRPSAYQWSVVMKYLDNLIAWGDQLFLRDTIESINEATQLYLLAADILGPRPHRVRTGGRAQWRTYSMIASSLDEFSNILVQVEALISRPSDPEVTGSFPSLSMMTVFAPYFCIPRNDKFERYWDLVENRLFKIRHCMNIEGIVRQLPLYEPPIDPGLLVRARAAGVDLGTVLNDTALSVSTYRFDLLSRRATELCAEVRSLASALLSAIEKQDAERLTLMRAEHESTLLGLVEEVRQAQLNEAQSAQDSLLVSRKSAVNRFLHYERMLGTTSPLEPKQGETIQLLNAPQMATVLEKDGTKLLNSEREEFERLSAANDLQVAAGFADVLASYIRLIPDSTAGFAGSGVTFGGSFLGSAASMYAGVFRAGATQASYEAGRAGRQASLILRENDWVLQRNQAALDIMQIDKQLIGTDIRIDIAKKELRNHRTQVAHSQAVEDFLRDKFSNKELYGWMVGQVSSIHFQAYQLAYDIARRAEKGYRHELGLDDNEPNFIQFGYWDSLKKGLLAGEKLSFDIKRMEAAYLERNKRELEITKHVSLRQLDPAALMALRVTGECEFELPEWLFDLDFSGHYFRRIKTVSLSIPCVVGPYTSVNGTLTNLSSKIRDSALVKGGPYETPENYRASYLSVQSIATSTAQNDSGMFELNFRDERYLPFEGAGVVGSRWRLALPKDFRAFDYDTISDVVLHIRYTARESSGLRAPAIETLKKLIANATQAPLQLILDLRRDFPTQWAQAKAAGTSGGTISVTVDDSLYPLMFMGMTKTIVKQYLWMKTGGKWSEAAESPGGNPVTIPIAPSVTDAVVVLQYSVTEPPK